MSKKYNHKDKILFLDVDGVLNGRYKGFKTNVGVLDDKNDIHFYHDVGQIDREKMKMLNDVVETCNFKVVLSSCWRIGETVEYINKVFHECGATFDVIDFTPHLITRDTSISTPRGFEIHQWIDRNIETKINGEYIIYQNFAILDDECCYMLSYQEPNIFKCDFETGITNNICYRMKLKYNKLLDL